MAEDYKISLGIDLDTSDLQSQINRAGDNIKPIDIKVDAETKELTKTINEALKSLSNGSKNTLTLNTTALENSLREVKEAILDIKNAFGTLDNKSNMKSLLSSINQIATTIGRVTDETDTLVKSLNILSKKEFGFNFNLKTGNTNPLKAATDYGREARRNAIPQLQQQASALQDLLGGYDEADKALERYLTKIHKASGISIKNSLIDDMSNTDSIAKQMEAIEKYIGHLKQIATTKGINLDGFDAQFSKSAENIVDDTVKIQTGAKQAEEALEAAGKEMKQIFGGGVSAEGLSTSLEPIIVDLGEIRKVVQDLSKNVSLDALTASFDRLSNSIEKLVQNATKVKNVLGDDLGNASSSVNGNAVKIAQQTGQKIGESVTKSAKQSLNLDDVIDEQTSSLMKKYEIAGGKNSKAFKEIRQALVDYRKELQITDNVDDSVDLGDFAARLSDSSEKIRKVTATLSSYIKVENQAVEAEKEQAKKLLDYIKGSKVKINDDIKSEYGKEYSGMRKVLGAGFGSKEGLEFDSWLMDFNDDGHGLNYKFDLSNTLQDNFKELYDEVNKARELVKQRGKSYFSEEELYASGNLNRNELVGDITSAIDVIDREQQRMAQVSETTSSNVVQDQKEIKQAYESSIDTVKQISQEVSSEKLNDIFDSESLNKTNAELEVIQSRIKEIDALIEATDNKAENLVKSMQELNRAPTQLEMDEASRQYDDYTSQIGILEQEKSALQARESILKEQSQAIKEMAAVTNNMQSNAGIENLESDLKQTNITIRATEDHIENLQRALSGFGFSNSAINTIVGDIEQVGFEVKKITHQLNDDGSVKITVQGVDDLKNAITAIKSVRMVEDPLGGDLIPDIRNVTKITQSFNEVEESLKRLKSLAKEMGKVDIEATKLEVSGNVEEANRLRKTLDETQNEFAKLRSETQLTENQIKELDQIFANSAGEIREFKNELAESAKADELANGIEKLKSITKEIANLKIDLFKFEDTDNIQRASTQLAKLEDEASELRAELQRKFNISSFDEIDDIARKGEAALDKLVAAKREADNALAKTAKAKLADTGAKGYEQQINKIKTASEKFVGQSKELREALNRVDTAFDALNTANEANDTRALADAYKELERAIKQANSQLTKSKQLEKDVNAAKALQQEKTILNNQMETWLRENTRAAKDYGDEIRKLQASLNSLDAAGVKEVRRQFNAFKSDAKVFGKTGLTVFDSLKKKIKEYSTYFSAAELFMYAEEALRSMFEQVKLIDTAMTELKKVTDETDESYSRFLTNAASRAKEIGTTIDGLVESTAAFARLGYGFKDAQGLAEVANIYAVVGDEVEGVEGATESLISTMAAFKDEMNGLSDSDFAMSIVDKMNEVANRYSITSGGLGEALQRSASSMAAANNTLDETIALTTAANEVVQNPEKVGNALKTVSMRIRSAKTEMEEAGIETEGMVESTAKLRSEIMALSGVDIMASATEFKSTYAILDELSEKWEDLSDISQATIIELMAGRMFARICRNTYKEYI